MKESGALSSTDASHGEIVETLSIALIACSSITVLHLCEAFSLQEPLQL